MKRSVHLVIDWRFRRQAIVVQAKEVEHGGHVPLPVDVEADPAGVGQDVVWGRAARRHELLADAHWERQVGQPAAVEMPDLVAVYVKLDPAEAMGLRRDARPAPQLALDDL